MADFTDVANSLVGIIAGFVYPNGTSQPSTTGDTILVYQGWPLPQQLTNDLTAGKIHISVWPTTNEKHPGDRFPDWQQLAVNAITLTPVVSGKTITLGGTASTPSNVALVVDKKGYVYAVQTSDTPTSIAAALAALVSVDQAASSSGSVVTIPNAKAITARVGTTGTSIREVRRQVRVFQISIWANCFDKREPISSLVDAYLAGLSRISLPDGSQGIVTYASSVQHDDMQKQGIFRRDLMYAVDFSTTQTRTDVQVSIETLNLQAAVVAGTPVQITNF